MFGLDKGQKITNKLFFEMKKQTNFIFLLAFTGLLISCYKDNFGKLHPQLNAASNCDTILAISYSTQIVPIINNHCISCHGTGGSFPDLSTYAGVQTSSQSTLYGSVIWDGSASQMPKNSSSKLPICDLTKIKKWIAAGSPNN